MDRDEVREAPDLEPAHARVGLVDRVPAEALLDAIDGLEALARVELERSVDVDARDLIVNRKGWGEKIRLIEVEDLGSAPGGSTPGRCPGGQRPKKRSAPFRAAGSRRRWTARGKGRNSAG